MKKLNGELKLQDHIRLFLIAVITLILPSLLFQPRKNMPVLKSDRKTPAILADARDYQPGKLKEQLYYHDPKVFLEGDDAHSFASFRIREQKPEYLLQQISNMPPLLKQDDGNIPPGKLPDNGAPVFSSPIYMPLSLQKQTGQIVKNDPVYPLLFNTDGTPLPDCRIRIGKNTKMPLNPTKLQINIPVLDALPGFLHAELLTSCGDRKLDLLAQRSINQYLLANSNRQWQNGGILTVYWQQNVKVPVLPGEQKKEGGKS